MPTHRRLGLARNVFIIWALVVPLVVAAAADIGSPPEDDEIDGRLVFFCGIGGLAVNCGLAFWFWGDDKGGHSHGSMSKRAAYVHVGGDVLESLSAVSPWAEWLHCFLSHSNSNVLIHPAQRGCPWAGWSHCFLSHCNGNVVMRETEWVEGSICSRRGWDSRAGGEETEERRRSGQVAQGRRRDPIDWTVVGRCWPGRWYGPGRQPRLPTR